MIKVGVIGMGKMGLTHAAILEAAQKIQQTTERVPCK